MPLHKNMFDYALCGAGSVGISFLYQFLCSLQKENAASGVTILIVDPRIRLGSGLPYQPGDKTAILNTRSASTTAVYGEPEHFHAWLVRNSEDLLPDYQDLDLSPTGFVPRSVFGRYLEDMYLQSLELAHRLGVRIIRCRTALSSIKIDLHGAHLQTGDGNSHVAKHVILCIGNPPSRPYGDLTKSPRYIQHPYPGDRQLASIPPDASVCVIGSGLTAIDVVIALHRNNGVRDIVCVSRNGRMQSVKSSLARQPCLSFLTPDNLRTIVKNQGRSLTLAELADLYIQEVEAFSGEPFVLTDILRRHMSCHEYLMDEIRLSEEGNKAWQATLYAINDVADEIWRHLSDEARTEFLANHRDDFMSYKVAIPVQSARLLATMLASGELRVLKAASEVKYQSARDTYVLHAGEAHRDEISEVAASHVVNATGFPIAYTELGDALVDSMVRSGLAVPSPFGGLKVDFESSDLIDRSGHRVHSVSCLGTATVGTYFWTNGMDVNSRIASRLAVRLARERAKKASQALEQLQ